MAGKEKMNSSEKQISIKNWMKLFSDLYSKSDSTRIPEQLWIAVMAHSSSIGESIRTIKFPDLLYSATHTFCWLCSFINKCNSLKDDVFSFNESFSEMVSLKYPLICGHCEESHCQCRPVKMDAIKDKSAHYEKLFNHRKGIIESIKAYTIAQWKLTFGKIYGEQIHILTLESIGLHFLEEAGEGAFAVRKLSQLKKILDKEDGGINATFLRELSTIEGIVDNYKKYYKEKIDYVSKDLDQLKWRLVEAKMNMIIEIGDTFSWFCSILNKLDNIYKNCELPPLSLEEKLNKEYFDKDDKPSCPTCNNKPCSCIFFS